MASWKRTDSGNAPTENAEKIAKWGEDHLQDFAHALETESNVDVDMETVNKDEDEQLADYKRNATAGLKQILAEAAAAEALAGRD